MPNFSSGTPIAKRITTKLPQEIPEPQRLPGGSPRNPRIRPADKAYITVLPEVSKRSHSSGSIVHEEYINWTGT